MPKYASFYNVEVLVVEKMLRLKAFLTKLRVTKN